MTTFPDGFNQLHLDVCDSTNDYLKRNSTRLEADFPLMVSADSQTGGRGREGRGWFSAPGLGVYATFAFALAGRGGLSLLSTAAGVAVADTLQGWTDEAFVLKWPNDILAAGRKIAGILCETTVKSDRITCLVGIGINVNHQEDDFPAELRERASSLRLLTGREWPLAEGRERLAASLAGWLRRLETGGAAALLRRARALSRSFLGKTIVFHQQGRLWHGVFRGLAADGALRLETEDGGEKIFYSGEIAG